MRVKKSIIPVIFFCSIFLSCSESVPPEEEIGQFLLAEAEKSETGSSTQNDDKDFSKSKTIEDLVFSFDLLTAYEFIERSGQQVKDSDRASLSSERVGILEIKSLKTKKILDLIDNRNSDEVASYLIEGIRDDLKLVQGDKTTEAAHISYDGNMQNTESIRIFYFFQNIKDTEDYYVLYNDELFNKGLIRL